MDTFVDQQELQNQLSAIVECTPGAVYWKGIDGKYLGCNQYMVTTSGFSSSSDLIGKTDYDFFPKEEADRLLANDQKVIETKLPLKTEEIITFKNDLLTFAVVKIPLINKQGEVVGIVGNSVDITDSKKLSATTNLIKGVQILTNSLAHELRTPLVNVANVAKNMTTISTKLLDVYEIAKASKLDDLPLISKREVAALQSTTEQILKSIKQSLKYIDLVNNSVNLTSLNPDTFSKISIKETVDSAVEEFLESKPPEYRNLININLADDFEFVGDKVFISHVLLNLLDNAVYFINKAGKGDIAITSEVTSEANILHFKDTGAGIDPEHLPHVFEHFFSKKENGTGIGLALARYVLQSFNGDITCDSAFGEFTTFTLSFPKVTQHEKG